MELFVNGEPRDVETGKTILGLLGELEITPDRVAVELNRSIVKKEFWATTELRDGAKLEIVHFVGGG